MTIFVETLEPRLLPALIGSAQVVLTAAASFVQNALVATFADSNPAGPDTAIVIWNEGNGLDVSTIGRIVPQANNTFAVYGSTPFSFPYGGLFPVQVQINPGSSNSITIASAASVAHNTAIPPLLPQYQAETTPFTASFLRADDALNNLLYSEELFMVALGFGTLRERENGFGNLLNALYAYNLAVYQFDITLAQG